MILGYFRKVPPNDLRTGSPWASESFFVRKIFEKIGYRTPEVGAQLVDDLQLLQFAMTAGSALGRHGAAHPINGEAVTYFGKIGK
jgi:hypothetical protein